MTTMAEHTSIILLVEDSPAHAELILRIFQRHPVASRIFHVRDGEGALEYLFREGAYADPQTSPRPDVILLDLRLPKKDGFEVLQKAKSSEELRRIPIVVLSTSNAEADMSKAYQAYANSYLVKPLDFSAFADLLDTVAVYWLRWNCRAH